MTDTLNRRNYSVNYCEIEIPLAVKIKTAMVNKISYFLESGLSIGFIGKTFEKRIPLDKKTTPIITDVYSFASPVRVNYFVGAGVEHAVGNGLNLFGSISYKSSLTNVANSAYVPNRYSNTLQMFPGSLDFSVGIMF